MRHPCLLFALTLTLGAAAPVEAQSIHDRIYQPPTTPLATLPLPAGARLVTVTTRDGLTLTGAEIAATGSHPTLLVFHGNASTAAATLQWFAPLIAQGYGVVAAEYRGYAGNPGRPDEAGLAGDADAFYVEGRHAAGAHPLIVIGHSLGGGVAFGLARRQRLDALVTIATFTRLRAMAPRIARAFVSERYDNLAIIPALDEPYFLIHGTADGTVPASEGQALDRAARAAHRPGGAFVIRGADHHPDGATIAAIIDRIDAQLEHPAAAPPPLPATVTAAPFNG